MNVCLTGSDLKLGIFVVYLSNKEFGCLITIFLVFQKWNACKVGGKWLKIVQG